MPTIFWSTLLLGGCAGGWCPALDPVSVDVDVGSDALDLRDVADTGTASRDDCDVVCMDVVDNMKENLDYGHMAVDVTACTLTVESVAGDTAGERAGHLACTTAMENECK